METKLTLTVKEMAALLQVSLPTAYQMTERADFPLVRVGTKKLVNAALLQEWLNKQTGVNHG